MDFNTPELLYRLQPNLWLRVTSNIWRFWVDVKVLSHSNGSKPWKNACASHIFWNLDLLWQNLIYRHILTRRKCCKKPDSPFLKCSHIIKVARKVQNVTTFWATRECFIFESFANILCIPKHYYQTACKYDVCVLIMHTNRGGRGFYHKRRQTLFFVQVPKKEKEKKTPFFFIPKWP